LIKPRHPKSAIAPKGFRKLKAHKQLPILRAALIAHQRQNAEKFIAPASRAA